MSRIFYLRLEWRSFQKLSVVFLKNFQLFIENTDILYKNTLAIPKLLGIIFNQIRYAKWGTSSEENIMEEIR